MEKLYGSFDLVLDSHLEEIDPGTFELTVGGLPAKSNELQNRQEVSISVSVTYYCDSEGRCVGVRVTVRITIRSSRSSSGKK